MNSNLKPITTKERAIEIGRKGGLSKSPKKAIAARIQQLSLLEPTRQNQKRALTVLNNPNASILHIQKLIDAWFPKLQHPMHAAAFIRLYQDNHKLRFGEKHINMNIGIDQKPMIDILREVKKQVEEDEHK